MYALLEYVDATPSTNDVVSAWVRAGCDDGRALWAGHQTAGRGRLGRTWVAPPDENLTMSIAVVGARYAPVLTMIPLAAGVGVADAIAQLVGIDTGLKWPNDLLVRGRKLGGILCEGVVDDGRVLGAVIGIGLNVNTPASGYPRSLQDDVTTLVDEAGVTHSVEALANAVRMSVVHAVERLALPAVEATLAAWRGRDVTSGRVVDIDGEAWTAVGLANDGGLIVARDQEQRVIRSGEVRFRTGTG
jgi:BirA family biotin operon repressor/biotin-[acetyl-CoA-carboxylase] ligase